jgi:hypothetical protein
MEDVKDLLRGSKIDMLEKETTNIGNSSRLNDGNNYKSSTFYLAGGI